MKRFSRISGGDRVGKSSAPPAAALRRAAAAMLAAILPALSYQPPNKLPNLFLIVGDDMVRRRTQRNSAHF